MLHARTSKTPQIALAASAGVVGCIPWLNWAGWCSCSGRLGGCRKMCCDTSCRTFPLGVQKDMDSQDMYAGNEDTVGRCYFSWRGQKCWIALVCLWASPCSFLTHPGACARAVLLGELTAEPDDCSGRRAENLCAWQAGSLQQKQAANPSLLCFPASLAKAGTHCFMQGWYDIGGTDWAISFWHTMLSYQLTFTWRGKLYFGTVTLKDCQDLRGDLLFGMLSPQAVRQKWWGWRQWARSALEGLATTRRDTDQGSLSLLVPSPLVHIGPTIPTSS